MQIHNNLSFCRNEKNQNPKTRPAVQAKKLLEAYDVDPKDARNAINRFIQVHRDNGETFEDAEILAAQQIKANPKGIAELINSGKLD